jgi:hypothetical protein
MVNPVVNRKAFLVLDVMKRPCLLQAVIEQKNVGDKEKLRSDEREGFLPDSGERRGVRLRLNSETTLPKADEASASRTLHIQLVSF